MSRPGVVLDVSAIDAAIARAKSRPAPIPPKNVRKSRNNWAKNKKATAPGTLGHMLRELREARGMSQGALANAAGTANSTVSHMELGTSWRYPSIEMLARIAAPLRLTHEEWAKLVEARVAFEFGAYMDCSGLADRVNRRALP